MEPDLDLDHLMLANTSLYVHTMLERPCFETRAMRVKLELLGLNELPKMNLLPPSRTVGEWNPGFASQVAASVIETLKPKSLYLCGRKVQKAFNFSLRAGSVVKRDGITYFMIPHPSSLNRFWNDAEKVSELFQKISSAPMYEG